MSDLRLARLYAYVEALRYTEGLPRVRTSEACRSLLYYTAMTPDPMLPVSKKNNNRSGSHSAHDVQQMGFQNPYVMTARSHGGSKDSVCNIS
ncbi:hypothetical protein BATDEDRAFT_87919 [Batrachochytrium dendrobatidis JAM81]|uniref:Uncharacterized protein n=1 Tax=Batrachochytrium dendrobatidis (strain JAM81 / FGSC 10211) TaxID=684364 RepID=F4P0V0_BATDJ|nr:uncharacterized protein BATDEDRAFT_87919 [Batrachochytrium dendrobatidis JAM81]EGF81345.1 hypothetical protein BATDEDRAFT_87919 [Batrachochytrium dendrobatidis JAM81]KAJ8329577.1 Guanine nucleotide-binding protein subunit gamma [Batrachochytrium dendrobatidis]KAK5669477.1 Guanine nucleotide-binding protein subunit gamma [Batrachochytrium dendrobatidis]|eukprot:XP_006678176.1 hypothetical protein BATDEDRAFT_87919 [Batrachochytrium dendrobatidis JAM81]